MLAMGRTPCFTAASLLRPSSAVGLRRASAAPARCARRPRAGAVASAGAPAAAGALILDCDGVIVESEELHREAYNACWAASGLSFSWSPELYGELQNAVGGGRGKMRWYFDREGWPAGAASSVARDELLDALVARKTELYLLRVSQGVPARPGVVRVIDDALARGVPVGVASAANRRACKAVLESVLGEDRVRGLRFVIAGDDIAAKKPAPDIYLEAVRRLAVPPGDCVVVEDSLIGVQAAAAAGVPVVVTYTDYTKDQDFSAARAVFPDLGDPDDGGPFVDLDALLALRAVRA